MQSANSTNGFMQKANSRVHKNAVANTSGVIHSEHASSEFRNGNLSGLLRDSSGAQFKSLSRGLRNNSNLQSKENLVDVSTTSSNDKLAFNKNLQIVRQKQLGQQQPHNQPTQ